MNTRKASHLAAVRARVKRFWSDFDYANRRMFDIRTSARFVNGEDKSRTRATRRKTATAR
jgi:hypothetical protein